MFLKANVKLPSEKKALLDTLTNSLGENWFPDAPIYPRCYQHLRLLLIG